MTSATALILWTVAVYQTVTLSNAAGCSNKADVTFVLDSSDTVGQTNFAKQLEFVKNTVNNLDVQQDQVHVSALTFSSGVHNQFFLNNYATKADVLNAISGIKYLPGSTDTGDAITYATQTSFTPNHGARGGVPHVMVLVTDGPSTTKEITKLKAQTAKDNNILIYTIGVGHGIDADELKSVSSDPDSRYFMTADNYNSLNTLSDLLATKICNEIPSQYLLPQPTGCLQKADVVFMVDSSSSVGTLNLEKTENFIKNFVTKLNVGKDAVHVGLEQYSSRPSSEFPLRMYDNRYDVLRAIQGMQLLGGGTNTGDAIEFAKTTMFSPQAGARSNVPRIAIMITDGGTAEVTAAINEADQARQSHIGILGVGVGSGVNTAEMSKIVDQPSSGHMITVNSYDQLETVTNQLMSMTCGVQSSINFQAQLAECRDKINNCHEYGTKVCSDYQGWASENCKAFCGICQYTYTIPKQSCSDVLSDCSSYGKAACTQYQKWANDNCKQYCGFCTATAVTGGFYNQCAYKGKVYSPGEKWYDGCDYECVCQDGASGKYQCYNRCPVYYNLPSMCTLVRKNGGCCLEPVCNFNPSVQKFESSGKGMNALGIAVCVYKNNQYYEGQSWTDGCDYQCTCTNAAQGVYQCEQLCPSYTVLPQVCHLEQTPGQCCQQPVCEFTQQAGMFSGNGMVSGSGTSMTAPVTGPCLDLVTCSNYGSDVCTTYRDWAMKNCRNTCNFCPVQTAGPNDRCVYDGKDYKQGEVWAPKCDERCSCENAKYGYYRCVNTCPKYTNLPSGCSMVKLNGECCAHAQCSGGVFLTSAMGSYSLGGGTDIHIQNPGGSIFAVPTVPGSSGSISGTGIMPPTIDGCLYNGKVYAQDQAWMDGCSKYCTCVDATKGQISCRARCPTYAGLTATCVLDTDPNDPCCRAPKCTFDANLGKVPQPVPTFGSASLSYSVVSPSTGMEHHNYGQTYIPLLATGITPAPPTVNPAKIAAGGYCLYNNQKYNVGDKWDVGCQYNCICDDGQNGHYTCVEKCVHYDNLPIGCYLIQDEKNPCCKAPRCSVPPKYDILTGIRTTPSTKQGVCSYNGQFYQQGQTWYDGCSYRCTCEDAENGIYRCLSRCPEYPQSTSGDCKLIRDPRDPTCCEMRVCSTTGGTSGNSVVPPAKYTGLETTFQGKSGVCIYKGQAYKNGDIWEDGCDFTCQCEDEIKGTYTCTDRCPVYVNLQPGCTMVRDFSNPCCEKPDCSITGPPPTFVYSKAPNVPPTLAPAEQYCVYKGVSYLQGQVWEDGCSFKCRCDDSSRGIYTCNQRCAPLDPNMPEGCSLKTDPRDPCCLAQFCTQTTIPPSPGMTNPPTPIPTMKINEFTGQVYIPTPAPIPGQPTPTPAKLGVCIYKGVEYAQGQTFTDGCDYDCVCFNADEGRYRCSPKCPVYSDLPSTCRLVKNPRNPCCQIPECYSLPPTTPPPTQPPVVTPSPTPYTGTPTQPPPVTPSPQPTNPPTPQPTPPQTPAPLPTVPKNVCVYKGVTYSQGQQWYDGCEYSCVCEDGVTGVYRCNSRCPQLPMVDASCTMQPDPKDPLCCKIPMCTPPPQVGQTTPQYITIPTRVISGGIATPGPSPRPNPNLQPSATPTYYPPVVTVTPSPGPTLYPQPTRQTTQTPAPLPETTPQPVYKQNYCVYKGKTYSPGQQWQDGCQYDCECIDNLGNYRCKEKCIEYTDLQPGCRLIVDYTNPCCQKPYCPPPPPSTTPNPFTLTPPPAKTVAPPPSYCMYNGVPFRQGQTWNDGCDLKCVCEDASTGFYRCDDRCPQWPQLPSGCYLTTDPNDQCCKKPVCEQQVLTPPPTYIPTPRPTTYPGEVTPAPMPTQPPTPYTFTLPPPVNIGYAKNCQYKGVVHRQGEKWDDGCSLVCECLDEMTGRYRCVAKCQDYSNLPRPPYCNLVADPRNPCCKVIQCNPTPEPSVVTTVSPPTQPPSGPTPAPTPGTTLAPGVTPHPNPHSTTTRAPGVVITDSPQPNPVTYYPPTPAPQPKVCVYKGVPYTQGQQWYDGCDKICICENGMTGYIRCRQRCTTYDAPGQGCTMVPDPKDPQCCQIPSCIPATPGPSGVPIYLTAPTGKVTGFGTVTPTPGFTPVPTPRPGETFPPQLTPAPGVPGQPTVAPTPGVNPTPMPKPNYCVYKGVQYKTGQRWQDGCDYNCICEDGMTGHYTCSERCPSWPANLPASCSLVQDPRDFCCKSVVCNPDQTTPFVPFIPPTDAPTYNPLAPTTTPAPYIVGQTTPKPQPTPPAFCVYYGVLYKQGQTWDQGCQQRCRCDDASNNYYTCFDRCPTYPNLPVGCTSQTDPSDPCCQIPVCPSPKPQYTVTPAPTTPYTGAPTPAPTPYHGPQTPAPVTTPPPTPKYVVSPLPNYGVIQGGRPSPSPNSPFTPQPSKYCEYKGVRYSTGQKWRDGCDFNCVCVDGMSGVYQCTERCPKFPQLPAGCVMVTDVNDPCCRVPSCPATVTPAPQQPTPSPKPGGPTPGINPFTTPSPLPTTLVPFLPNPSEVCTYKGKTYTQGQAWYDGCDMKCVCTNGMTGVYQCSARCPQYDDQPGCIMIPDPSDPECCMKPQCPSVVTNPPIISGTNPPQPQVFLTFGPVNGFSGGTVTPPPNPEVCIYDGKFYKQGQKWQDGCKYTCECVNAMTGLHKCIPRCSDMANIPPTCQLKYNPQDPCCPLPDCVTPIPGTNQTVQPPTINPLAPQPKYCIYNGIPYRQGQTFDVGCEKRCRCDDADNNIINCDDRCPTYPPLGAGCQLLTDPNDQCCQAPLCVDPNPKNPYQVITAPKGTVTGGLPPQGPNVPKITEGKACVYNGQIYRQGQKWKDGCLFECECFDEQTGRYRCTEVCERHPQIPSFCTLVQDPNNACCQTVYCPIQPTTQAPQPYTGPHTPKPTGHGHPTPGTFITPAPLPVCMYNGVAYRQGQQWYDGCNQVCRCEDAMSGFYRCQQRCARYDSLPAGCTLVADPKDPQCCTVPQCEIIPPNATPTPGIFTPPVPVFGSFTGSAPNPTPQPTMRLPNGQIVTVTPVPGQPTQPPPTPQPGCVYKGRSFLQGQKWEDGCQYICECINQMIGQYKCTERCQSYPNLPPYCTLVENPKDKCCPVPYCDKQNPTPSLPPTYIPYVPTTNNPSIVVNPPTNNTITGQGTPSPFGMTGYCVYQGVYYTQGQTWDDGCDKRCRCDDVTTGLYSCTQRCPVFNNIPNTCTLVTDNNDPCCTVPQCNFFPSTAVYTGKGSPPTTARPQIFVPTPVQGALTGQGTISPLNPNYNQISGSGTGVCVYKGRSYTQGQKWDDGCDYRCECIDAMRGRYKCDYRCPQYYNLPAYCHYENDPADACCRKPKCDPSLPQPVTTQVPIYIPPSIFSTKGPGPKPVDMCVYKNQVHMQGSTWEDGCDYRCTCENATMNIYQCKAKCRLFQSLPSQCTLVQDPTDNCCYIPRCTATGSNIPLNPYYNSFGGQSTQTTPQPGKLNIVPVGNYQVISGNNWQKPGTSTYTGTGEFGACVYKNVVYNQGQSWDDGCQYVCTCKDAKSGQYECVSKCPSLPDPLPSYCKKIVIPGQCCAKLQCDIPGVSFKPPSEVIATPAPTGSLSLVTGNKYLIDVGTPKPTEAPVLPGGGFPILQQQFSQVRSQCIFHQKATSTRKEEYLLFNEGETWKDGCEYNCKCMDGKTGYYYCDPLCPVYNNLPSNKCFLQKIDGQCCNQPMCTLETGEIVNPLKTQTQYTIIGSLPNGYTGFGPNYNYSASGQYGTGSSGSRSGCIYKGRTYQQGQRWSDGCEFDCKCDDSTTGAYTCTPRCPTYTSLPSFCQLIKGDQDCCARPVCDQPKQTLVPPTTTTAIPTRPTCAWCFNELDNCADYGQEACQGAYQPWAKRNCANYCGLCDTDCDHTPATTTPDPYEGTPCKNKLDNCEDFGNDACFGIFHSWALENCPRFCHLCAEVLATPGPCQDKQPQICQSQKDIICNNQAYQNWAAENCQFTCQTCPGQVKTTPVPKDCVYKTVQHAHGSTWNDGCALTCECQDGIPTCKSRCATYDNLPPNWSLVKDAEGCCDIPVYKPTQGCHYKGNVYNQDDTWTDGCSYDCVCNDASNGQYQCKEKCPAWSLPTACHWDPPPAGKCCPRPVCPLPYVIQGYPDV